MEPDAAAGCQLQLTADVLETEPLVLELRCETGELPPEDLELTGLPEGAAFDAGSRELRWVPELDQAGRHRIQLSSRGSQLGAVQIDVVDKFDAPDNVPVQRAEQYLREYNLPVIHLGVSPDINDDSHQPATLTYQGHSYAAVTAKYRGSTSRKYPKRSYTLKFDKNYPFVDADNGFRGARRIVLTTTFDDNSFLRQRLAYALWNDLSDRQLPIHAFHAVVFLDGHYQGLYLVSDHIDDDFLNDAGVYRHVNLYKGRKHDANFRLVGPEGEPKLSLHAGYTKEEGIPEEPDPAAFADLDALVAWLATASDAEFASEFEQRMMRDEFEAWLMLVALIQATDSAGKNSYLYHDPRDGAPEPRWRYLPWDFNASFGQGYRTQRRLTSEYPLRDFALYNELFARLIRDEQLNAAVRARFRAALDGPWASSAVLALLDEWAASIEPSALRDERKWGAAYREFWSARSDLTTYLEEVQYLRRWIEDRWSFMQAAL